jgi:hypothetical protein
MDDLTRRDLIKLGAAATVAASVKVGESIAAQPSPVRPAFFTPQEFALVDELSELIVPADEHSPGARAAKVAAYIDSRLADAWDAKDKAAWRDGLKLVDRLSREASGRDFVEATPAERLALLTRMAGNEAKPQKAEELFFVELKARVVQAYYSSEIGIRQDLEYKGNTYLVEFAGVDVS